MRGASEKAAEMITAFETAVEAKALASHKAMSRGTLQRRGWAVKAAREAVLKYLGAVENKAEGVSHSNLADMPAPKARKTATRRAGRQADVQSEAR